MPSRKRNLQGLLLLALVAVSVVLYSRIDEHRRLRDETIQKALSQASDEVKRAAQEIDLALEAAMPVAVNIAEEIELGTVSAAGLSDRLMRALEDLKDLAAVTVAFESEPGPCGKLRQAYSIVRRADESLEKHCAKEEDHTDFSVRWYRDPIFEGAMWVEPQRHAATNQVMLRYAVPFEKADGSGRIRGVASVSYPVSLARSANNRLGRTGYAWIVSREGRFVLHPRQELVQAGRTFFQDAWEHDDVVLYALGIRAVSGKADREDWVDEVTGKKAWVFYQPITNANWSLVVVYDKEGLIDPDEQRRQLIDIVLWVAGALFLLTGLSISLLLRGERAIWGLVAGYSVLVAGAIAAIWYVAERYPTPLKFAALEIYDVSALHRFVRGHTRKSLAAGVPATYVRTGVFMQSIEFASGSNVEVTGYVWQHYRKQVHGGLSRGFVLPEAVDPDVEVAYHKPAESKGQCASLEASAGALPRDCDEVIGWYFSTLLRQSFDYSKFPFDRQEVWLRLWHEDFERNTVLLPDLAAYETMNPDGKPGVEKDFVLPGWTVTGSNFDYRLTGYNTNFGLEGYIGQQDFPELYFNVSVKRNFLGAFVSKIIPLMVVAIMLFAILLIGSKQQDKAGWLGFSAKDVVLGASALFFVVIFDHASLRNALGSSRVMYLEYFYFALYLAIMFVSVNAILFASTMRVPVIDWRDNLVPKLVFWPLYMTTMLTVTVIIFR